MLKVTELEKSKDLWQAVKEEMERKARKCSSKKPRKFRHFRKGKDEELEMPQEDNIVIRDIQSSKRD